MEKHNSIQKLALWHWHIEISSKCPLKCPRCTRVEVPETLSNRELSLEFFKSNFTPEFIQDHVEKITFCGDDGDPIYASSLFDVISYIKSIKPVTIVLVTNGSYRKQEWWEKLGSLLTSDDQVHFSLDGWDQASNEKYRIGSNWVSIMVGIKTLRKSSDVFMTWAAIGFSFNETQIDLMRSSAKSLGFDDFQLTKSTKFGKMYPLYLTNGSDVLQPSDSLLSNTVRFERVIENLSGRQFDDKRHLGFKRFDELSPINNTLPLCFVGGKGLYISAKGQLFPCCWVANRFKHNQEWNNLAIDLNKTPLKYAVDHRFWSTAFMKFRWMECKDKCNTNVVTKEYSSIW